MALPSKGGVQTGPEVLIVGQGCQGAGGVPVALVQEGGEGRVHALGTLGAPKLLRFKHLHTQQGQRHRLKEVQCLHRAQPKNHNKNNK